MLDPAILKSITRARLIDARALLAKKRFDAAIYLSGYAVEVALKARIVKTLKWSGFPETNNEFNGLMTFKTHKLKVLLLLSGWEHRIKSNYLTEWTEVDAWDPEMRYAPPGGATEAQAIKMIASATKLVGVL